MDLLEQFAELQVLKLVLSGGEIFLRSDIVEILAAARRMRFFLHLKTSGQCLSRSMAGELARIGPNLVDLSFYSHRPAVHDSVTGVAGSFDRTLAATLELQSHGLDANAVITPMRGFGERAGEMRRGLEELGIRRVSFNRVDDALCSTRDIAELELPEASLTDLFRLLADDHLPRIMPPDQVEPRCGVGFYLVYVGPDGTVQPCGALPISAGNVRETTLARIWRESEVLKEYRTRCVADIEKCTGCSVAEYCRYCLGRALNTSGDASVPPASFCRYAHLRKRVAAETGGGQR